MTREESDRYLRDFPAADGLDVLFISHLVRAGDDHGYTTNQYPTGRLKFLETRGVLVSNGEEHRHNFGPGGEGYGHVMLLGLKELVQPVSIGFGIAKTPPDYPPLALGIETAHQQDGTAIWCHNNWGFEDIPNWLAGRVTTTNKNEYGRALFGHTSAVYVPLQSRTVRRAEDVAWLRRELEAARAAIREKAQFDKAEQRDKVLGLYDRALRTLSD